MSKFLVTRCLAVCFFVLFSIGGATTVLAEPKEKTVAAQPAQSQISLEEIKRFSRAYNRIKHFYVTPVEDQALFESAIRGMLSHLDPHSDYLNVEEFKALQDSTAGKFAGLGIEVGMDHGLLKIISPLDDTPAYKAGLKAGDYIIRLNGTPIKGMTLREALNKMRGKKGSEIKLTVLRRGENKPLEFQIVRDFIQVKSVKSKMLTDKIGYLRISQFQLLTIDELEDHVQALHGKAGGKLTGLVLDLRNNPGGLLDSAVDVSDAFLDANKLTDNKRIVYTKGRIKQAQYSADAKPGDVLNNAPLVVLINEGSASSSEIVAGALQDHKRAVIVGKGSFGKGSVQTVIPLDDLRGLKITTALYYTPKGRTIQAQGIKPDVVVKVEPPEVEKPQDPDTTFIREADLAGHLGNSQAEKTAVMSEEIKALLEKDNQLEQAVNVLKGLVTVQQ